jgi:hypothetical protein
MTTKVDEIASDIYRLSTFVPDIGPTGFTFGHIESDECGSMNQFLAAAPHAQVAHGARSAQLGVAGAL